MDFTSAAQNLVTEAGGVHLNSSGLYLPPQWALHTGLSRDLSALPGLMLTAVLGKFRLKVQESLWRDSFSKTAHKVLPLTSKQPVKGSQDSCSKTKQQRGRGRTEACTGHVYTHLHVLATMLLSSMPDRLKTTNFHQLPPSKPATGS